jgi:tRNA uridine 5-carboxymethylaminomethyl modification enzyme
VRAETALRRPNVELTALLADGLLALDLELEDATRDIASVETAVRFEGYLKRQEAEVQRARRNEERRIPHAFSYGSVPGLSREIVQRLSQIRPGTLGQALRIPGVTPAAVAIISARIARCGESCGEASIGQASV